MRKSLNIMAFCLLAVAGTSVCLFSFVACATSQEQEVQPAFVTPTNTKEQERELVWRFPTATLLESETPSVQKKSGVTIVVSIEPIEKSTKYEEKVETRAVKKGNTGVDRYQYKDVIGEPLPVLNPENLRFKITITNQMDRVMRLSGTVLTLQIDGSQVSMPQESVDKFLGGLITPRSKADYLVDGPAWTAFLEKESFPIALFLYDVPIEIAPSGDYVLDNFQWYYQCKIGDVKGKASTKVERQVVDTLHGACETCDGKGVLTCESCGGSGKNWSGQACQTCGGDGTYLCGTCKGKRK